MRERERERKVGECVSGWVLCFLVAVYTDGPCALALQIDQPLAAFGIVRGGPFWVGG